jgi:hypothetical protein
MGVASAPVLCSSTALFDVSDLTRLGESARCYWSNDRTLVVEPSLDASSLGGTPVSVRGGVISRRGAVSYVIASSVVVRGRRPAPSVSSAIMDSYGSRIFVTFTSPGSGEIGGSSGAVDCSALLDNRNLGSGSSCFWSGPTTVTVEFGVGSFISPRVGYVGPVSVSCEESLNTTLSFRAGVIVAVAGAIASMPAVCVVVSPPVAPVPPLIQLSGPNSVGPCDQILVDASSTVDVTGRSLIFNWTILPLNDDAGNSSIFYDPSFLTDLSRGRSFVRIRSGEVNPGSALRATVTVTNFLGAVGTRSLDVSVAAENIPSISIDGAQSRVVSSDDRLSLTASGSVLVCSLNGTDDAVADKSLRYSWKLVRQFALPGVSDASYNFTVIDNAAFQSFVSFPATIATWVAV